MDIMVNDKMEWVIKNGDICIDESPAQVDNLLIIQLNKGQNKTFPTLGCDPFKLINSPVGNDVLIREITEQIKSDGRTVKVTIEGENINIE